ncbi:CET1 [[Candida] subhashii]|uniref:mRNA-capping enzyme subunit beta n=1 Tax=[Candida] subhashii TaxID=561895 RepID=A0A8J5QTY5_9ASCO|nr:CET1 [[Candida] subhashii]KAG7666143.1 CET1 [[Candida] subhashii]
MNVGSILNNDSPPTDNEAEELSSSGISSTPTTSALPLHISSTRSSISGPSSGTRPSVPSVHERHSITNMLNDAPTTATSGPIGPAAHNAESEGIQFRKPSIKDSPPTVHHAPPTLKRNSIADITNETDVDISTGEPIKPEENESKNNESIQSSEQSKEQSKSPKTQESKPKPKEEQQDNIAEDDEDELQKLRKALLSKKPKRYETPPIWAQRWIPPNQQGDKSSMDQEMMAPHNGGGAGGAGGHIQPQTRLSDKHIFDYTTTRSVDLQCSITGVIPPASLTRTIAEWIFANFSNIEDRNRKYVELELKFGKIVDKRTGNRINVNVITECIFTDHSNIHYDMEVEELAWNDVRKFFEELEKTYQDERKDKPAGKRKFNMLDSDATDSFYQLGGKGEHIRKVRVSKDNLLDPPRYIAIEKERISDLYIHNPSSMYDLRLSLSLEIPVPESNIEPIISKNKPVLVREKKRTTWTHAPTITQFDLTRVLIPREAKNKHGKKIVSHDIKYEIELEIDTLEVFNAIDKITQGTDNFRLEELVEVFINNARVINNRVTKLALP